MMLVPFVIDTESLKADPSDSATQQRAYYNQVLDVWKDIGLLVHDGESFEKSMLYQATQGLPEKFKVQWMHLLRSRHIPLLSAPKWDGKVTNANLDAFSAISQLAFVEDLLAETEFNINDDCDESTVQTQSNEVYICRIFAANQARLFKKAKDLAQDRIYGKNISKDVWNSRFSILAKAPIKIISIVDRYALQNHMNAPQHILSGLEQFLRLLDDEATGDRYLTVYSAMPEKITLDDIETAMRTICMRLKKKNIKELKVHLPKGADFPKKGHDRFIRFENYVWEIGLGLEVFDDSRKHDTNATFKTVILDKKVKVYSEVEQELENKAGKNSFTSKTR